MTLNAAEIRQQRALVIAEAKSWLRTPYHNCQMVKGAGVDCAMLMKAVYETVELGGVHIDPYSPQWYMNRSEERYLGHVMEHAVEITQQQSRPGDMAIFKFGRCFSHGTVIIEPGWPKIIHAYVGAGYVVAADADKGELGQRERKFFTLKAWLPGA